MEPKDIVASYLKAWAAKDFETARSLLADDLSFVGPIDTFDNADDYQTAIKQLSQMLKGIEQKKMFVDGRDVCVIYDLHTPMGAAPVAEWYRIKRNKIGDIRVFFDARPFAGAH